MANAKDLTMAKMWRKGDSSIKRIAKRMGDIPVSRVVDGLERTGAIDMVTASLFRDAAEQLQKSEATQ